MQNGVAKAGSTNKVSIKPVRYRLVTTNIGYVVPKPNYTDLHSRSNERKVYG